MARVQKFCGCGSLRTGAITAAVLHTIFVSGLYLVCFVAFINASYYDRHGNYELRRVKTIEGVKSLVPAILGTIVVVFLSIGIHKGKPTFIIPWIVYTILTVILWIIAFIFLAVTSVLLYEHTVAQTIHIAVSLIFLSIIIFTIYLLIVVYSFYQTLKENPGQIVVGSVPTTDPVFLVAPASGPSPFYGPTYAAPPLYPQVPPENEYPAHFYQKPPAYTSI